MDVWEDPGGPYMGSCECVVMGLKSGAASALITKHFVTIFNKTFNKYEFRIMNSGLSGGFSPNCLIKQIMIAFLI